MQTVFTTVALLVISATALAQTETFERLINQPTSDTVEGLQEQHVAALKAKAEVMLRKFEVGAVTLDSVLKAQLDVLDIELEYSNVRAERVRLAEGSVESLRNLERMVLGQFASATVSQLEVLSARASRLHAEIVLLEEKRGMDEEQKRDPQIDNTDVEILEELVAALDQANRQVSLRAAQEQQGGEGANVALTLYKLSIAKARLAHARGDLDGQLKQQQATVAAAKECVDRTKIAYEIARSVPLDLVIEAITNHAEARLKLNDIKKSIASQKE